MYLPAICLAAALLTCQAVDAAPSDHGVVVDTFVLPDGASGAIERLGERYQLNIPALAQPVLIEGAASATFRSAQEVDGSTLVVLQTSAPQCAVRLHLVAIRERTAQAWPVGDCRSLPKTTIERRAATFEVAQAGGAVRYRFAGGRLGDGQPVPVRASAVAIEPATEPAIAAAAPAVAARPLARKAGQGYVAPAKPVFTPRALVPATISVPMK
jgi:hypothetical protein